MELDFERCYRAVDSRDQRFDGWFFTGVTSTGIYCRPSCPAITPKRQNVRFFPSAAAAQRRRASAPAAAAGRTPRPGRREWDVRADVVGRAMRLIADGVVDRDGVPGLAARLGYTERHLHRMLRAELGAGPLALARAQRAQTARILIETTGLGLAEIAFAAGFGSVRQFNDTIREVYGPPPSELRAARGGSPAPAGAGHDHAAAGVPAAAARRGAAGLPRARARCPASRRSRDGTYRRALRLPHGTGEVALTPGRRLRGGDAAAGRRARPGPGGGPLPPPARPGRRPGRRRRARSPPTRRWPPAVAAEPGVRVPRAVDGFEIAVRAIVGQQISVAAARTILARLLPPATTLIMRSRRRRSPATS